MYADEIIDYMRTVNNFRRAELLSNTSGERREHLTYAHRFTENVIRSLNVAQRYLLDVRQAEAFAHARLSFETFPPLVHHLTYVEFNGRLRFNYSIPYVEDGVSRIDETPEFKYNDLKLRTEYRSVLIIHCPANEPNPFVTNSLLEDKLGVPKNENFIRALWFEPIANVLNGRVLDDFVITFSNVTWPMTIHSLLDEQGERHAKRLLFMTANLLSFLAAENLTFVRVRPEDHERHKLKGLPRSTAPYHVLPFQVPRYRYLHPRFSEGTTHGHRYDVRGYFRHLRDERYARNADGSVRVLWIPEHQRGLAHDVYVPALQRGVVGADVIECDQFIRGLEREERSKRAS